jgi:hypothetical protein
MKKNSAGQRRITNSEIYLGVRFTSEMIFAQIVLGDDEVYSIGQPYSGGAGSVNIIRDGNKNSSALMENFGIRPEDLTMSFLFWNFVKELPGESVSLVDCRVFLLASPDRNETAKVYIGRENYFPVKVEWAKTGPGGAFTAPSRTMEVASFRKLNGLYIVDSIIFYGPGWKSKVDFSDCRAGFIKDGIPKDLFRKTAAGQ